MYNSRRRLRNYEVKRIYTNSISSLSREDALAIAYYLFELSKNVENDKFKDERDFMLIFFELVNALQLTGRLREVLESYMQALIDDGALVPLDVQEDSDVLEDRPVSSYANRRQQLMKLFVYENDELINRIYDIENLSKTELDFLRIFFASPDGVYSQLIYNVFFSKAKVNIKKIYDDAPARIMKYAADISKINFIKKELNLSDQESGYLLVRYRKASTEYLDNIFNLLSKNSGELYTKLLGITKSEFNKITRSDNKLRQYGFINEDRELNPALLECIESQDFSIFFADCIKNVDLDSVFSLDSFSVPTENSDIYRKLLGSDNSISMLLYGNPGSGKTEYAKALIKACGKKAMIFKNEMEVTDKTETLERLNCLLSLDRKDRILIIDEADSLLETARRSFFGMSSSSENKGLINKMLEQSQNKVIWIVNYKSQIDESTLRRFTVSYQFNAMTPVMLESIAKKKLDLLNVSETAKERILKLVSCYKVTGSSIDNIIKTVNSMSPVSIDEDLLIRNVEVVLKDNSMLLNGKAKMREYTNAAYDSSILNTSMPAEKILKMLNNAKSYADKNPGTGAIRMLFYGLSGTGKTEFARYISQLLGKKILLKRASDIFGCYVGETEENIAKSFKEAADKDMILLFDEADSFFSDRNNAVRNFERTQVNEFLTQLEEFPGIVICTTNLRNIMDAAMLRRFHITVEFNALKQEGIETLLARYFPSYKFDSEIVKKLIDYDSVTPGDFGRLSDTIRFMDAEDITSELIIEELCNIQKEKNDDGKNGRKIGFCA